jgi:hypothetical protein
VATTPARNLSGHAECKTVGIKIINQTPTT